MVAYVQDAALKAEADAIIANIPERANLKLLKIAYMFRPEASASGDGKLIAGRAIRVDDRNWSLHKFDFLIEIAKDVWDDASTEFRTALMDHELGHVGIRYEEDGVAPAMDEKTMRIKTYCRMHDIEEFADVMKRHGAYHDSLRNFLAAHAARIKAGKKGASAEEA